MTSLKGDPFDNRYRIHGVLTTASPLHIGTGEERPMTFRSHKEEEETVKKAGRVPGIATIITDYRGKPLIPGSSLRGVLRNWLLTVLAGFGGAWAVDRDYQADGVLGLDQAAQIQRAKTSYSHLERIFGTPVNAGKVEVWDVACTTPDSTRSDNVLGWNPVRLTYEDTSVAIDPARGTARDKALYTTDVVPPGVTFDLDLVGQNLSNAELGLVLLALEGFNSAIYPIHVGARGGRGFGRMQFALTSVYRLNRAHMKAYLKNLLTAPADQSAGYFGLPQLSADEQKRLVEQVKRDLVAAIGG